MFNFIKKPRDIVFAVAVIAGCQPQPKQQSYDDESKTESTIASGGSVLSSQRRMVTIPVSVSYGSFGLLGTPATSYSVTLAGCLSLYTATVTQANLDGIEVYKDDRNCKAKLTSITTGGSTYTSSNPGATDFTDWDANDTALFTTAGGAKIRVKVISQLATPISGTEAVVYHFSEMLDATSDYTFSEADVSDPHLITVESEEAPHFKVSAATFAGMDDASGAPEFNFTLLCVDDPTAATPNAVAMTNGAGTKTVCGTNELADISYILVKDTYSSVMTVDQAETAFAGATPLTIAVPGDQYDGGGSNNGFTITALDGPGPLGTAGNENMILILKAGISFTYYNIDVTTITQ